MAFPKQQIGDWGTYASVAVLPGVASAEINLHAGDYAIVGPTNIGEYAGYTCTSASFPATWTAWARPTPGYFDIRNYGALASPNDIGTSVAAALTAAIAAGGGTVFIPPRADGTGAWGWSTPVSVNVNQDMSMAVVGVLNQTVINIPLGVVGTICDVGNSNGDVTFSDMIFTASQAAGINCTNLLRIRQARLGRVMRCQFYGVACNGAGFGIVRATADTTHVEDLIFNGCGYFGNTVVLDGACLVIDGQRDACVVKSCRFMQSDQTFRGVTYNKSDPNQNAHIFLGAQGAPGAVTAYGERAIENCYFEAAAVFAVGVNPGAGQTCDHVRIWGCTFNHPSNNAGAIIIKPGVRQLVIEGTSFGNAAADQWAVWFEGQQIIVRESVVVPACAPQKIKFTGATTYVEIDNSDGFSYDTTLATPAHGGTWALGVWTQDFP